jgi:HK97 gp10 family phage protein
LAEGVTVELTGLKELESNLRQFSAEVQDTMLLEAVREGAEVVRAEAIRLAPRERGLASPKSIISRIKIRMKQPDRFGVRALVIAGAPHSHLLEFGTKAHKILAKVKKALADKATGKFFGKVVNHPGNRARPFLRPAYETRKVAAVNRMAEVLRERIAQFRAKAKAAK